MSESGPARLVWARLDAYLSVTLQKNSMAGPQVVDEPSSEQEHHHQPRK